MTRPTILYSENVVICTMPGCQTSAGCKCNQPVYLAPFTPSPADEWYGKELAALNAEIDRLRKENEELKAALREDAERMKADQDAIDRLRLALSTARADGMEEAARIAETPITYRFDDGSPAATRPIPYGEAIASAIRKAKENGE